jgi:hydroxyacylglutathione hydrolase
MISTIHPIPAFSDNYIWAIREAGSYRICVVDPGDAHPVIDYLNSNDYQLSDILITHHHPDHTGGIQALLDSYDCRVIGPGSSGIKGLSEVVKEDDRIEVFGQTLSVIEVPGHTLDHIAYYCEKQKLLFCGDTLFAAGCGRLFEGTPAMMNESLSKLSRLPQQTQVYCTHEYTLANLKFAAAADSKNILLKKRIEVEEAKRAMNKPTLPSSIELELETNPFLRCNEDGLKQSAATRLGREPANDVEVFSTLRSWKDSF